MLVVDDDPDILGVTQLVLECAGFAVETATNGREALELLDRGDRVCLILLDLMMPVASGWWFRAKVEREPRFADIPIVILSGAGLPPEHVEALRCAGFLTKPVELTTLVETARAYCSAVGEESS